MKADLVSGIVPHWARTTPQAIAVVEDERRWTYEDLDGAIRSAAETLLQAGLRAGDRLVLVCENCCAAVSLYFACTAIGGWPVVLGSRLTTHEIEGIFRHSGARLMLVAGGPALMRRVASEWENFQALDLCGGTVYLGPRDETAQVEPSAPTSAEDVAALIYTTGTTGKPKGVMLTHANLMFVARASARARRLSERDRLLAVLPMSHILGLTGVVLGGLASGAAIQFQQRFDPGALLTSLARDGLTVMIGTPAMYAMLCEYQARKGRRSVEAPALRLISTAGAPLDAATKHAAEELFGLPLHNGYGMTECSPTITVTDIESPRQDCSVGRLLAGIEARLVDSCGNEMKDGEAGELWIRGPGVMKGYYRAPDETVRVLGADGWFKTGDIARATDGNLMMVGRSKEMVIRFGFKVYPSEIEGVLNSHPEVARSAVVPAGADNAEEIFAYVQLREGSPLAGAELSSFAAERLAPYKRPSKFVLVERMPLSPSGKILKSEFSAA